MGWQPQAWSRGQAPPLLSPLSPGCAPPPSELCRAVQGGEGGGHLRSGPSGGCRSRGGGVCSQPPHPCVAFSGPASCSGPNWTLENGLAQGAGSLRHASGERGRGAPLFQRVSWRGRPFSWAWKTGAWTSGQLLAFRGGLEAPCGGSLVQVCALSGCEPSTRVSLTGCADAQRRTRKVTRSAAGQRPCRAVRTQVTRALGAVLTPHWFDLWEELGFQHSWGLAACEARL